MAVVEELADEAVAVEEEEEFCEADDVTLKVL